MGPIARWPEIGTETIVSRNELRPGGSAGNTALALRYLGGECRLISLVGNDSFGTWLRDEFTSIDASLPDCDAPTSLTVGIVHDCTERTFFTTEGHLGSLSMEHVAPALSERPAPGSIALLSGAFLTPLLRPNYGELVAQLKSLGYRIALDVGWPPGGWSDAVCAEVLSWVRECDHILFNETEIVNLTANPALEYAVQSLAKRIRPDACLVAKTGPKGALAIANGRRYEVSSRETDVFDTIGAGDSFNAGYLLARQRGAGTADALQAGCDTAVSVIRRFPRRDISTGEFAETAASVNSAHAAAINADLEAKR